MKAKKVPLRKCIACGKAKEKKELIRIVKDKDENVFVDKSNKANGRGAYVCIDKDCFDNVEINNKLSKSLQKDVPNQIYQDLKDALVEKSEE